MSPGKRYFMRSSKNNFQLHFIIPNIFSKLNKNININATITLLTINDTGKNISIHIGIIKTPFNFIFLEATINGEALIAPWIALNFPGEHES